MSNEDDTYSTMFTALKHPIRRKILRILNQTPTTYTDIQTQLRIENGLLNYHLDNMRDLISKRDDGKYSLSEFGQAALSVTEKVEAPSRSNQNGVGLNKVIGVVLILTIAIASLAGLSFVLYGNYMNQGKLLSEKTTQLDQAIPKFNTLSAQSNSTNSLLINQIEALRALSLADNQTSIVFASSYGAPVSRLEAITIAFMFRGWNSTSWNTTNLKGMEISENLEYQSIDSGGISEHIVNHQISDFSQKTVNGVTYRYVWEVSLYNPNLGTILSGDYWVDASTGKIETFVHL